jgi:hypothetical protein
MLSVSLPMTEGAAGVATPELYAVWSDMARWELTIRCSASRAL